jgi:hypothetical protein
MLMKLIPGKGANMRIRTDVCEMAELTNQVKYPHRKFISYSFKSKKLFKYDPTLKIDQDLKSI